MNKELEKLALDFDRKLKRHPMSNVELQKVLCEFAEQYAQSQTESLKKEIEELKKKTEWISVEDDLPKEQCHCLVIAPKSFPKNCTNVVAEFYEDNKIFYSESSDYPMEDVTHWMPLPTPPNQ